VLDPGYALKVASSRAIRRPDIKFLKAIVLGDDGVSDIIAGYVRWSIEGGEDDEIILTTSDGARGAEGKKPADKLDDGEPAQLYRPREQLEELWREFGQLQEPEEEWLKKTLGERRYIGS
jgi:hypothetical protein